MCTVTYLPTGENSFILTHNRDEQTIRETAALPAIYEANGIRMVYPRDPKGGGTWIGMANNGMVACLLNGAFERHIPHPPYKHSRGLVILDMFSFPDIVSFFNEYPFQGLEPFTLIIFHRGSLWRLIWDGQTLHREDLPSDRPHIYSSTMLYEPEVREKRQRWFREWLEKYPDYRLKDIRSFHNYGGEGDSRIDLVMKREMHLQTLSITSIQKKPDKAEMLYNDLINHVTTCTLLNIEH